MMNRWYDNYPNLRIRLDAFKEMDPTIREPIIKSVIDLIEQYDPSLLSDEKAYEFPFDSNKRRWYDNDPYLWLMFNTLKVADETLLQSVEVYLVKMIEVDFLCDSSTIQKSSAAAKYY